MDNLVFQKPDENNNLICNNANGKNAPISKCLACGRRHLFGTDKYEHCGDHFQLD